METITAKYTAQQRADGIVYDNDGAQDNVSEFIPEQYDTALIFRLFKNTFKSAYEALKRESGSLNFERAFFVFVKHFNAEFREMILSPSATENDIAFYKKMLHISVEGIDKLNELKKYDHDYLDDPDNNEGSRYVDVLIDAYSAVVSAFKDHECLYDPKLARTYLDSFFDLSKEMVFKEGSFNLTSSGFRRSFFLRTLLSFAAKREQWEVQPDPGTSIKSVPEEKRYIFPYYFSYFDPFAYDSIERALICATRILLDELRLNRDRDGEDFFELRKQMFICSLEAAFQRSITIERQAYRIELNRHSSLLLAYPIEPYSSTSDTKPIRLFEKTASYIQRYLRENPDRERFKVVITIIGHTGSNKEARRRSVTDYLAAVLTWYNTLRIPGVETLPSLRLIVNNIQNYIYKPTENARKSEKITKADNRIVLKLNGHSASCSFSTLDYESYLAYNLKHTKEYIYNSQVLFLLDCPWLSTENYSIRDEGTLGNYCARLHKQQRAYSERDPLWVSDFKHYYERSPMTELSNQFNRIMSSSSRNAGLVVRSMRDDLIRAIQMYMDNLRLKPQLSAKELYVFSSENDGINYSYIDSYPLTRLEQYDGQHFTIIQFTNRQLPMLPCGEDENVKFEIDLWGVLKYLCIPYAYQYAVEKLFIKNDICWKSSALEKGLRDPIQYLELLQNIVVRFDVSRNMRDVSISYGFTEHFIAQLSECLKLDKENGDQTVEKARLNIDRRVYDLLRPLYLKSVFAKNQKYGDDAIKMGFKMALYSAAKDVHTMLFCRVYRDACEAGDFSHFRVRFVQPTPQQGGDFKPRNFASELFFADKKLYSCLLDTFKTDYNLTVGMFHMLDDSKDLFILSEQKKSVLIILLNNLKCAIEAAGLVDSKLYLNLLRAIFNHEG